MCTVLLPLGGYPIAVKYIISYHNNSSFQTGPLKFLVNTSYLQWYFEQKTIAYATLPFNMFLPVSHSQLLDWQQNTVSTLVYTTPSKYYIIKCSETMIHVFNLKLKGGKKCFISHPIIQVKKKSCPCACYTHIWWSGGTVPLILNLHQQNRWVVCVMSQLLYPHTKHPVHIK
jgi:hypothetical protein